MAKKKIPEKYQRWIDARKRYHLSHAHIQMARELGLNPKKFGSLANTKQEPWKLPLPEYIEELYFKHFNKSRPDSVRSIEQMGRDYRRKKQPRYCRLLPLAGCSVSSFQGFLFLFDKPPNVDTGKLIALSRIDPSLVFFRCLFLCQRTSTSRLSVW